jgi:hypothetical protein
VAEHEAEPCRFLGHNDQDIRRADAIDGGNASMAVMAVQNWRNSRRETPR